MQRKCISAVLWQNPMKHASNIHPNVLSFWQTVTHGELHRIIYKEFFFFLNGYTIFLHLNLPTEIPPNRYMPFQQPTTLPPSPETNPGDTWIQSLISNFFSFNPPQYESNHHKQNLLITIKARFRIVCSNFNLLSHKMSTLGQPEGHRTTI